MYTVSAQLDWEFANSLVTKNRHNMKENLGLYLHISRSQQSH